MPSCVDAKLEGGGAETGGSAVHHDLRPRVVQLNGIHTQPGQLLNLPADDGDNRLHEILARREGRGRMLGAPHAPAQGVRRWEGDDDTGACVILRNSASPAAMGLF